MSGFAFVAGLAVGVSLAVLGLIFLATRADDDESDCSACGGPERCRKWVAHPTQRCVLPDRHAGRCVPLNSIPREDAP